MRDHFEAIERCQGANRAYSKSDSTHRRTLSLIHKRRCYSEPIAYYGNRSLLVCAAYSIQSSDCMLLYCDW